MPSFQPMSIHPWPADRAILLVHGIGDGSARGDLAFPIAELKAALGAAADKTALYTLNYDFINDWAARKLQLGAGIATLGKAVGARFNKPGLEDVLADYVGDVLWPVLHRETRLAIRDAFMSQLDQIVLDCGESALERGDDPLDYHVSLLAHSLGCFHTYEALHTAVREPRYHLQPATDLTRLESVVLMASPVQLIRSVAAVLGPLTDHPEELATLDPAGLALPAEVKGSKRVTAARKFVSVTGSQDPVGGHLFGARQDWAFMDLDGQQTKIVQQSLLPGDPVQQLTKALKSGSGVPAAVGAQVQDPHSWTAYITSEADLLNMLFT